MGRFVPLLLALVAFPLCAAGQDHPGFIGGQACKACHAAEFEAWQGSHHDLAMQSATEDTVLGNFDNAEFSYNGVTTRFFRKDGQFMVRTDGEDGKLTDFPVPYVFGVYPLQQYLLPLSGGRLQALSIAWDSRPASEGGQRWFHLYPDDTIDHSDPLHWTGPYQNWNTRCAECHSTDLQKNYSAGSNSFDTRYFEVNVSCEACHGPGEQHRALAQSGQLAGAAHAGFPVDLAQRGEWAFPQGESIARRRSPVAGNSQIDTCGRCHSRRGTLGEYHYGRSLSDTHRLSLPHAPLYYHDGQIRDEVYVYGSFTQSKMHQAGVVCSNCHEPHSLELRAPGNGVCAQCHKADTYDVPEHHHHPAGSSGAQCANCHMPETTYMVVDPRRDHSMRIPRPDLGIMLDTPNACTACHSERDDEWALQSLREWGVHFSDTATHPARAFAGMAAGDTRAVPRLAELATDTGAPAIWRAAAVESLGQSGDRQGVDIARGLLTSADPLLRTSAVNALSALPLPQRFQLLRPLVNDPVTSVRLAVAEQLAPVPLAQLREADVEALRVLFGEYQRIAKQHADMPGNRMQLGIFLASRGDAPGAEAAYRGAIELNPQLVPARLNLADLLRAQQRDDEAKAQLQEALAIAPDNGPTLYALGLLETRAGNSEQALDYLGRAARLETTGTRQRYVYAVALHDLGQPKKALTELEKLLRQAPQNPDVLLALANYSAEQGKLDAARRYARQLQATDPRNPAYNQLLRELESR
ncbi:tetratricopeptide repeat protein [Parahaliea mediterranea]|uniref:tetratricopeptide repeat protein n=1 Tax=Parahaliea mediterranea TaxID=651086 RepID=UPI001F4DFEF6|nr:tetratricopeptide repeat protein [Parahaliea mediterranea]